MPVALIEEEIEENARSDEDVVLKSRLSVVGTWVLPLASIELAGGKIRGKI